MFRLASRTAYALAVVALSALVVAGATSAASVPGVVTTVSGAAVVTGTGGPATGGPLMVGTSMAGGSADVQRAVIGADGTYTFDLAYATNYYVGFEPDAVLRFTWAADTPYVTTYAPGWSSFDAAPGTPVTCSVEAVLTSSWTKRAGGVGWAGSNSSITCDNQDVQYARVYRFWSPTFDNAHFYTNNFEEAEHIRTTDPNWVDEGEAFRTLRSRDDGTCPAGSPVFRFHSDQVQEHFFTINAAEKAHLIATDPSWAYEGVAYCTFPEAVPGTTALYRFWSPLFGKHFFTANAAEKDHLIATDPRWTYEGIAYYVTV